MRGQAFYTLPLFLLETETLIIKTLAVQQGRSPTCCIAAVLQHNVPSTAAMHITTTDNFFDS